MQVQTLVYSHDTGWSAELPSSSDGERTLIVLFGAPGFVDEPGPMDRLLDTMPRARVVGCSTAGEILDDRVADGTLVAAVTRFRGTDLRTASAEIESAEDSFAAGRQLGTSLADDALAGVLVFADGMTVNGSEFTRGLNSALPSSVTISGGLAGDGDRFRRTWVADRRGAKSGRAVAVGLYGDEVRVRNGSRGQVEGFGAERKVTRARGNVLYDLDGRPALELYRRYLGDRADDMPAAAMWIPLGLSDSTTNRTVVVRTPVAVDLQAHSMTFTGDVPEGWRARLQTASFAQLIDDADSVATSLGDAGADVLSIAVSSVGRRLVLGERVEDELEALLERLPDGAQQVGFYGYGELVTGDSSSCVMHNQSIALTTITETAANAPSAV